MTFGGVRAAAGGSAVLALLGALALASCSSDEGAQSVVPLTPVAGSTGEQPDPLGGEDPGTNPPVTGQGGAGGEVTPGGLAGNASAEDPGAVDPGDPGAAGATGMEETPQTPETIWVGTWATGPQLTEPNNLPPAPGLVNNTLRQNVFPTLSGSRVRLHFSNEWGNAPVTFNRVRIARSMGGSTIDAASDRGLLFNGSESVTIPAGGVLVSDPIDFEVTALNSLAITIAFGSLPADNVTGHPGSRTTSFILPGDAATAPTMANAVTTDHWYFITGIDVEAQTPAAAIVTLGDSITDGRGSTTNQNDRWPDNLARRLQANPETANIAVLNQGIGGNAVLQGGLGPTALERFERDVLEQRGVRWVIILEGVNDMGGTTDVGVADRLIGAYEQMIDRAHERGLLVYGVPILPFGGSFYDTPQALQARRTVNDWMRTSNRFDAVIELDTAVADPGNPERLLPAYDSGDLLHLSPAGYRAMGDAIDFSLFQR